jgi:hypothetical protein
MAVALDMRQPEQVDQGEILLHSQPGLGREIFTGHGRLAPSIAALLDVKRHTSIGPLQWGLITKANTGIPTETTFSSVSGALREQLIFEFASLSSPTKRTDFLRNLISIRTAILHYLNKYRTIAATDTEARAQELLRHASGRKCNQKASGDSIECHELHS